MDSGKKASQSLYFNKNYKSPYTKLKKYNIKIELCVATSNSEQLKEQCKCDPQISKSDLKQINPIAKTV